MRHTAPANRPRRAAPSCRRPRTRRRRYAVRGRARVPRPRSRGLSYHAAVGFVLMPHGDLAQLAAVVGAVGAAILLLSRTRAGLLAGLAIAVTGEAMLAIALIPGRDLKLFVTPATHLAALLVGLLVIGALAWALVGLAALFSAVSLFQRLTHGHLLASDVERANAYTTYFRVTSLFKDPSVFGRHVVIAIGVLLVAIWLGRIRFWLGAGLIAFLWAGLLFAYSQSSFAALFADRK